MVLTETDATYWDQSTPCSRLEGDHRQAPGPAGRFWPDSTGDGSAQIAAPWHPQIRNHERNGDPARDCQQGRLSSRLLDPIQFP